MSDETIRRRVVNSFRKAIDLEQHNNNVVRGYSKWTFFKINIYTLFGWFRWFVCWWSCCWCASSFHASCLFQEAYRNYLEGLALVAAALQQDAESSWSLGNPFLTPKERRSLIGSAKQSVERLVVLLEKQGMMWLKKYCFEVLCNLQVIMGHVGCYAQEREYRLGALC